MNNEWIAVTAHTPRGVVLETKIDDHKGVRNIQQLKLGKDNNLWWVPDGSMYVYYQPTHYKL